MHKMVIEFLAALLNVETLDQILGETPRRGGRRVELECLGVGRDHGGGHGREGAHGLQAGAGRVGGASGRRGRRGSSSGSRVAAVELVGRLWGENE